MTEPILQIDAVTHGFAGVPVLHQVQLEVQSGDSMALIGPNGAGKTTLLRAAGGLLEPDAGTVRVDGRDLADMTRREIARRMSYLSQATPQVFDFSALELVLMGFHARTGRFSLPSDSQRDRALGAMRQLEIEHLAERPASVLSGGELQRVLMARTLVAEADVWLLDEPTSHLDVRHQLAMLRQVRRHVADGGTVLAVLHDLGLVHRFFDRVAVLKGGELVAQGPVDETLNTDLLSRVFEVELVRGEVDGQTVWTVGG
jgi:iron complex transport system ATP-binding protein